MRTVLVNHLNGNVISNWDNINSEIIACDTDLNGFFLIKVPDSEVYFKINSGDIIIFHYTDESDNSIEYHCAIVTFKDFCDKDNQLVKVKSFFTAPGNSDIFIDN